MKRKALLTIGLLLIAPLASGQAVFPAAGSLLPEHRTARIAEHLSRFQIKRMLDQGLNSPGDTLALEMQVSITGPVGAMLNGGGRLRLDVLATRTEDDGCELSMGVEQAASLGFELTENSEINAVAGLERRVIFAFPSTARAAESIDLISYLASLGPAALASAAEAHWEMAQQTAELVRDAILSLQDAEAVELARAQSYQAAARTLWLTERSFRRIGKSMRKLDRRLRKAERKIRRGPRWARKIAKRVLRRVRRALRRSGRALVRVADRVKTAQRGLAQKREEWVESKRDVDLERSALEAAQAAHDAAQESYDAAREILEAAVAPLVHLGNHTAGIEIAVRNGVELEASLSPLGISMANFGMGASASSFLGATVRWDFPRSDGTTRLVVSGVRDVSYGVHAGAVVGAEARFTGSLTVEVAFARQPGGKFGYESGHTAIAADVALLGVAGAGVAIKHGAAREISLTMTMEDWLDAVNATAELAASPSLSTLASALDRTGATLQVQDRWIGELVADFGFSVAGGGVSIYGAALSNDAGRGYDTRLSAGQMVRILLRPAWVQSTARQLSAVVN